MHALKESIAAFAVSHAVIYKHFLPVVKDDAASSYTIVTGGLGVLHARSCTQDSLPKQQNSVQMLYCPSSQGPRTFCEISGRGCATSEI
jgi:hypothetical protein